MVGRSSCEAARLKLGMLAIVLAAGTIAQAAVIASDDFTWPVTQALDGVNSGSGGWNTPWEATGWILSGNRAAIGTAGTAIRFLGIDTTAKNQVFLACDVTVPSVIASADSFAVVLVDGTFAMALGKEAKSNAFQISVENTLLSSSTHINMAPGGSYHIVAGYDIPRNTLAAWINPDAADFYSVATGLNSADATLVSAPKPIGAVGLRSAMTEFQFLIVDNLVLGETPSDVQLLDPLPEPGLIVLAGPLAPWALCRAYRRQTVGRT